MRILEPFTMLRLMGGMFRQLALMVRFYGVEIHLQMRIFHFIGQKHRV